MTAPTVADPSVELSLDALKSHLWKAADILRGSIDSGDYKHYIFGLLFYKRVCDVWDEEYAAAKAEHGEEAARSGIFHRINIPDGYHWAQVRDHSEQIGTVLNEAFRAIENANPALMGVFQDVDFANQERFPDHMIEALLGHFEQHRMGKADVSVSMMGDAYEYLIEQFADDAGKKGGEFYTPKAVVRLMVRLLDPAPGDSIYDPTCGAGGMLLQSARHVRAKEPGAVVYIHGQERNLNTWAICKMSLFLHGIDDVFIERGDTLLDPKFRDDHGGVQTFDRVIANPPFSLKKWGHETWSKGDPFGRAVYGCPPKSYGDLAFVQHMIASMAPQGRMAVVVPHGVLFRGGAEGKIRRKILEDDLIEAVVGLGQNLFYGTGIPAAVLYLNRAKAADRTGKVLIVNGEKHVVPGKNQNALSAENVDALAGAVEAWADVDLFCKVVDLEAIAKNDFNLNLTRYVQTEPPPPPIDVKAEVATLQTLLAERDAAEAKMLKFLKELGYVG